MQYLGLAAAPIDGKMILTFKDYPPRQKPASFNLDDVMKTIMEPASGN